MAVNTDKIELGACDVTFNAKDLGATKGGVEVSIETKTYEVKTDQTGETPVKDIITGTVVTVKVPMVETDLDRMLAMLPQGVKVGTNPAADGVEIRTGVNIDMFSQGQELLLHPTGVLSSDKSGDFGMFKAAPQANITFKYTSGEERVYEVTFKGYPDTANNNRIAWFGQRPA